MRFPWVLQNILGESYDIIEEWQRWRTLSGDNIHFPDRDGLQQFWPIFSSHHPIDLCILFLWTNDCNAWSEKSYDDVATAFDTYQEKIQRRSDHFWLSIPSLLIIIPPHTKELFSYPLFGDIFKGGDEKIKKMREHILTYVKQKNIDYFDCGDIVQASENDGIHIDEENNTLLAQSLAQKIQKIFT